jgi:putative surface-exposed virulence protein
MYGRDTIGLAIERNSHLRYGSKFNIKNPINLYGDGSVGFYNRSNDLNVANKSLSIARFIIGDKTSEATYNYVDAFGVTTIQNAASNSGTGDTKLVEGAAAIVMDTSAGVTSELLVPQLTIEKYAKGSIGIYTLNGNLNVIQNPDSITKNEIRINGGNSNVGIYSLNGNVNFTGDIIMGQSSLTTIDGDKNGTSNTAIFANPGRTVSLNGDLVTYNSEGKSLDSNVVYSNDAIINLNGKIDVQLQAGTTGKNTAILSSGTSSVINIASGKGSTINIDGKEFGNTSNKTNLGLGLVSLNGGRIEASGTSRTDGLKISMEDAGTALVSIGSNSKVNAKYSTIDYNGNGIALYTDNGGTIDITGSLINLYGSSVAFEKDMSMATSPITTTATDIVVYSNDVTVMSLKNMSAINLTGLANNISSAVAGINVTAGTISGVLYDQYKLAMVDGLSAYNIDKDLDKSIGADDSQSSTDDYYYTRRMSVQRAVVNVGPSASTGGSVIVKATLNSSELSKLGNTSVIGLDINSSKYAISNNETQINLTNGSKIIADRTDNGNGAVGLYINYGKINTDIGTEINVEKETINGANDGAVGIFGVNGSEIINNASVNVGGNKSIGILGMTYRTDILGNIIVDEFGTTALGQGKSNIDNKGNLTLDGSKSVGIYGINNNSGLGITPSAVTNLTALNNGNIVMNGKESIAMYSTYGNLKNENKITMNGTESKAIYGQNNSNLENTINGIIEIKNSLSSSNPSIGMYGDNSTSISNSGLIDAGNNTIGIYGSQITLANSSNIKVENESMGIYYLGNSLLLNGSITTGSTKSVGLYSVNGGSITNNLANFVIGNGSYGIISSGVGTTNIVNNSSNVTIGDNSVFIYSSDTGGTITNSANLSSTSNGIYGLYGAGTIVNNNSIDFSTGIGNVGIYTTNGGNATNYSTISVGASNASTNSYGIGMVADNGAKAYNDNAIGGGAVINVSGIGSVGMYAKGTGSEVTNNGTINLNQSRTIGMYIEDNALGINNGLITTTGSGTQNVTGVILKNGGKLINNGTIHIDTENGSGVLFGVGSVIANYGGSGSIVVSGTDTVEQIIPNSSTASAGGGSTTISVGGMTSPTPGVVTITSAGATITPVTVTLPSTPMLPSSLQTVAMYVDTSGQRFTSPMLSSSGTALATNLQIGTEITKYTNAKAIKIDDPNIINPYSGTSWKEVTSSSLTWVANRGISLTTGLLDAFYLAKKPYTDFASDKDTYNFADGLEQRYDMNALDSREKELFNKLNGIGNNEEILLYQAYDEMMGHQYANTQQRLYSTSGLLNKEFDYLANEWSTKSKQSNKIKVFGMKGEYNTDTAGIINYKNDSYGVAYVHEDETLKLGANTGWYAGVVNNTFKFKDIGGSKENTTIGKLGIFKTTTFDNNGSLKWKISGEGMLGYSDMDRKFLVVDEIFGAKSTYTSYGLALRNELSKEIRLSERTSLKPYGSIDIEYGKYGNIKEKTGEVRLEVKGNDYYSIKPELGLEYKYKQPLFVRTNLVASIGVAYENELGKVNDADNRARVAYTNADYFNLRGEKENREGNVKGDLKLGIENSKIGFTFDFGYDTEGENVRGGIGFRAIF